MQQVTSLYYYSTTHTNVVVMKYCSSACLVGVVVLRPSLSPLRLAHVPGAVVAVEQGVPEGGGGARGHPGQAQSIAQPRPGAGRAQGQGGCGRAPTQARVDGGGATQQAGRALRALLYSSLVMGESKGLVVFNFSSNTVCMSFVQAA